jgi:hypothetical protein
MLTTAAMSRTKLKLRLSYSVALIAFGGPTKSSVWPSAGRANDGFCGDVAAAASAVLNDEWLADSLR